MIILGIPNDIFTISLYAFIAFLMTLQLIQARLDEKHSTTLLKLVVLKLFGVNII